MNNLLKGYRALNGFTQEKMADLLQISLASYNSKEQGKLEFKQNEMKKLKHFLNLSSEDIVHIFFED